MAESKLKITEAEVGAVGTGQVPSAGVPLWLKRMVGELNKTLSESIHWYGFWGGLSYARLFTRWLQDDVALEQARAGLVSYRGMVWWRRWLYWLLNYRGVRTHAAGFAVWDVLERVPVLAHRAVDDVAESREAEQRGLSLFEDDGPYRACWFAGREGESEEEVFNEEGLSAWLGRDKLLGSVPRGVRDFVEHVGAVGEALVSFGARGERADSDGTAETGRLEGKGKSRHVGYGSFDVEAHRGGELDGGESYAWRDCDAYFSRVLIAVEMGLLDDGEEKMVPSVAELAAAVERKRAEIGEFMEQLPNFEVSLRQELSEVIPGVRRYDLRMGEYELELARVLGARGERGEMDKEEKAKARASGFSQKMEERTARNPVIGRVVSFFVRMVSGRRKSRQQDEPALPAGQACIAERGRLVVLDADSEGVGAERLEEGANREDNVRLYRLYYLRLYGLCCLEPGSKLLDYADFKRRRRDLLLRSHPDKGANHRADFKAETREGSEFRADEETMIEHYHKRVDNFHHKSLDIFAKGRELFFADGQASQVLVDVHGWARRRRAEARNSEIKRCAVDECDIPTEEAIRVRSSWYGKHDGYYVWWKLRKKFEDTAGWAYGFKRYCADALELIRGNERIEDDIADLNEQHRQIQAATRAALADIERLKRENEEIIQRLAEQDAALEEKEAALEEKDAALEEKDAALELSKQQAEAARAALEKERELNARLRAELAAAVRSDTAAAVSPGQVNGTMFGVSADGRDGDTGREFDLPSIVGEGPEVLSRGLSAERQVKQGRRG